MKITKSLVLSLFLLAFTTTFPSSSFMATAIHSADDDLPEPVLDINGQEVRAGGRYYVEVKVPFLPNASALRDEPFLAFSDISGGSCPSFIVLSTETKFPVKISPVRTEDSVIREDTYLTIKFDFRYPCRMYISLIWGITERNGEFVLTARGVEGLNQFKITKYKDEKYTYRLHYCTPLAGAVCGTDCRRLGYIVDNGVGYVSPYGLSFPIIFRPVQEPRHEKLDVIEQ